MKDIKIQGELVGRPCLPETQSVLKRCPKCNDIMGENIEGKPICACEQWPRIDQAIPVMKDNYGYEVPTDLIALTSGLDGFTDDEIRLIVDAVWYEVIHSHGVDLAISFTEAGCIEALNPLENPLGDTPIEVLRINDVLKRWDDEYGFYSA